MTSHVRVYWFVLISITLARYQASLNLAITYSLTLINANVLKVTKTNSLLVYYFIFVYLHRFVGLRVLVQRQAMLQVGEIAGIRTIDSAKNAPGNICIVHNENIESFSRIDGKTARFEGLETFKHIIQNDEFDNIPFTYSN